MKFLEEISIRKPLFGKEVEFVGYEEENGKFKESVEDAYELGRKLEKIFNLYDPESELSKLNAKRTKHVSDHLLKVIKEALVVCQKTHGEYDISLGRAFLERKSGKQISSLGCNYKEIEINGNEITLSNSQILLDLGSIAKGYIADMMANTLMERGVKNALIDARGDMRIIGKNKIEIEIQHPRKKEQAIKTITLSDCAVATSGDYNQYWGSFDQTHILNKKRSISVTVIAPTLTIADLYATAIFVTSDKSIKSLIEGIDIKAMTINDKMEIEYYNSFEDVSNG